MDFFVRLLTFCLLMLVVSLEEMNIRQKSIAYKNTTQNPIQNTPIENKTGNLTDEIVKEHETGALPVAQPGVEFEHTVYAKQNGTQINLEPVTFFNIVDRNQSMQMPLDYEEDLNIHLRGCKDIKKCKKACKKVMEDVCEEYNCKKFKKLFKRECTDKCNKEFSDKDNSSDEYDDDYDDDDDDNDSGQDFDHHGIYV